jgi:hypothetical protein
MSSNPRLADQIRARAEALEQFTEWQAIHPVRLSPAAALELVGALYELLPPSGRRRAVDASGVMTLHETLRLATGSQA